MSEGGPTIFVSDENGKGVEVDAVEHFRKISDFPKYIAGVDPVEFEGSKAARMKFDESGQWDDKIKKKKSISILWGLFKFEWDE